MFAGVVRAHIFVHPAFAVWVIFSAALRDSIGAEMTISLLLLLKTLSAGLSEIWASAR